MTIETVLLMLRIVSALVLMTFLGTLLVAIWRDTQTTMQQAQGYRRSYGTLQMLAQIDQQFVPTGVTYALLPVTTLGRSPTNTIVINHSFASADHASIRLKNGQWWLEDLDSTNGTNLNDETVTTPVIVTDGDRMSIGNVYFRLLME